MSDQQNDNGSVINDLEGSVLSIDEKLSLMERFIARRFDEISMEINATSQQVDMAEEGMAQRFGEILEIMGAISYQGDGQSQMNTGVELEAIINVTEEAANKILDSADHIVNLIENRENWNDESKREELLSNIENDIQNIIMSCTFQDLTGQRIRKTLENMQIIEERLNGTLDRLGINIDIDKKQAAEKVSGGRTEANNQDDIDALFG